MIKSVSTSQDEILKNIIKLHCADGFEADVTFGNGCFYKNIKRPALCSDLDPKFKFVLSADSRMLPYSEKSIKSLVFDPPFLTYIKNGNTSVMGKRFGGYWSYKELEDHYIGTISEASRVLTSGGIFIVKCQDIIHNHKMHATHHRVLNWCDIEGFQLLDMFILVANGRMNLAHRKQKHARIHHSYFLVFKKGHN